MQGEVHVHDLARHQEALDQPQSPRGAEEVGVKVDAQQSNDGLSSLCVATNLFFLATN